jgi:hypothetical protein
VSGVDVLTSAQLEVEHSRAEDALSAPRSKRGGGLDSENFIGVVVAKIKNNSANILKLG